MRKDAKRALKKKGKDGKRDWKSANDIKVVNYSVHSNNQNEYMQALRHSRPSTGVLLSR